MKTLFLMRHAKSSWDNPALSDFERPLNERGLKAAPLMGEYLRKNFAPVEIVVSSPAERAKQTAKLVRKQAGIEEKIRFDERIYEASSSTLLYVAAEIPPKFNSALLVGHNPGMESLIRVLTGEIEIMPTAALARVELEIKDWSEIVPNCGKLTEVLRPKELIIKQNK